MKNTLTCMEQVQIHSASILIELLSNIHNAANRPSEAKYFSPFFEDYDF